MKKIILLTMITLITMVTSVYAQQYKEERVYYTVKRGDFLLKIAEMYGTTVQELHRLNPFIKNVNKIYPGQRVLFIDRKGVEARKRAAKKEQMTAQQNNNAENARLAEEKRRMEEERQRLEQERLAAERQRMEEEKRLAEERRLMEERIRLEEQKRQQEKYNQENEDYPQYVAVRGGVKMPADIETMEVAQYGFGGAFDYNIQVSKWFAIMPSIDAYYLSGNNKGIDAKAYSIGIKPYFLFQPNKQINSKHTVQPYIGAAPTYTLSVQDVYADAEGHCNMLKNHLGISAAAGLNYIYKNFLLGIHFEYNYTLPISRDSQLIHLDMSSSFNAGIRLGYRF